MNKIKKFLASANSAQGFVQYFDFINDRSKNNYTFVLKGSAGSGKSTLMRKAGDYFLDKGYDIEFFYCSSDTSSLDGMRVKELNICIVDGTSPHAREVKMPLLDGEIVNLCEFANGQEIRKNEKAILQEAAKKKTCFDAAYPLIAAAKEIDSVIKMPRACGGNCTENILQKLNLQKRSSAVQFNRKLFGSALTENGIENIIEEKDYTVLEVPLPCAKTVKSVIKAVNALGYGVIEIMDLLNPYTLREKLIIEDADIMVRFVKDAPLLAEEIWLSDERDIILKKAGEFLMQSKIHHKNIENYYIKNMDFDGIDNCRQRIITQIEQMALQT